MIGNAIVHAAHTGVLLFGSLTVDIPNPTPTEPPGGAALLTIVGWVSWIVFAMAVVAVTVVGGRMMWSSHQGRGGGEAASGLIWVLAGCILASVASALVGALSLAAA